MRIVANIFEQVIELTSKISCLVFFSFLEILGTTEVIDKLAQFPSWLSIHSCLEAWIVPLQGRYQKEYELLLKTSAMEGSYI